MEDNIALWKWQKNKMYSAIGGGGGAAKSYKALLTSTGTGVGVSTLRFEVSANMTITLDSAARFYTDAAGTSGESTTWVITVGALRTIYLKCPSGTANLTIPDVTKIIKWGNSNTDGWTSAINAASITFNLSKLVNLTHLFISGKSVFSDAMPVGLTYLNLSGASIAWTYTGALPTGLTYLKLSSELITWTYTGALPVGLTYVVIESSLIAWTYNGALPVGLTYLKLAGNKIAWTYTGALPVGLTYAGIISSSIAWTYTGVLPVGLTEVLIVGSLININVSAWVLAGNNISTVIKNTKSTGSIPSITDSASALTYDLSANKFSDSNAISFRKGMTVFNISNQTVTFSTANIDKLLKALADWYQVNAPTASCTYTMTGVNMGIPTGGASNVDLVRLVGYYTAAGKTATITVRTS